MILTENEQSSEDIWAQGQTPQKVQECEEQLFSPGGSAKGIVAPSQFGKDASPVKFSGNTQWSLCYLDFSYSRLMLNEALRKPLHCLRKERHAMMQGMTKE